MKTRWFLVTMVLILGAAMVAHAVTITDGGFKAPTWVGIGMDQDQLFLKWDTVPGALAYYIWRSETSGSGYKHIGYARISRFVDKAGLVEGNTYYYVLTAINSEFDETPYSEERSFQYGMSSEEKE